MKTLIENTAAIPTLRLPKGELIGLRQRHSTTRVTVSAGLVWATRDCEAADYVLRPGTSRVFEGRGLLLIEALEDSEISVRQV